MKKMKEIPTKYPPSVFIREEMEARGWTDNDLAEKGQLNVTCVRELLSGHRKVTPIYAMCLANAFGVSKEFFQNLQRDYDESEIIKPVPLSKRTMMG